MRKLKKALLTGLLAILLLSMCWCCFALWEYEEEHQVYLEEMEAVRSTVSLEAPTSSNNELSGLEILQTKNEDCIGWLIVEGTEIACPVMHTPAEPEYYLRHSFYKHENVYGVPFLDARCNLLAGNLLIYGHNMTDGSVFSALLQYRKQDFFTDHQRITFETEEGVREYAVAAVLEYPDALARNDNVYNTLHLDSASWPDFAGKLREESLYNTGNLPDECPTLLTLSTCANSQGEGRFAVVAARVK